MSKVRSTSTGVESPEQDDEALAKEVACGVGHHVLIQVHMLSRLCRVWCGRPRMKCIVCPKNVCNILKRGCLNSLIT